MQIKKHARPLHEATIGDLTDRKCGFCGLNLQFAEVERSENQAWLSCPTFLSERGFSQREHSSYAVLLKETGYQMGDEEKLQKRLKESMPSRKLQHDQPKKTAQPAGSFSRR